MKENNNTSEENGRINRRNVLKTVGAAGLFAAGSTGMAAAADRLSQAEEPKLLTGTEKRTLARELAKTPAFRELAQRARADGAQIRSDADSIVAGYARGEDFAREVVQYDLENLTDAAEASIVIGRNPDTGEIEVANLDYYYETDDGVLDEVHRFEPTNASETDGVRSAATSDGATVISVDTDAIREAQNSEIDVDESSPSNAAPTPADIDITGCSACKYAAGQVCTIGCSAAGGFICGLLGITIPVAGLSCLGFVEIVCTVADEYSGCGDAVAKEACNRAGLC
uniref:Halocin C8 n=9 Tax=Natrinema TaxID=88723 RepID=A0A1W6ALB1_9EURY|nr:halocin C8 precursor [Natrinema sp. SWI15]AII25936.1 halocin C8 precursor [Natrinema sp. SSI3]AII25937.1 halocin C8 precursor [Natrinema sp. SI4]AII25938.1 halocin C8 precursor [Natrinema sp. SWI6]AII25939.1 halocin C8 precursor [Natrinema sp. SI14]ARJ31955.1 halocin C8 precursor [Natrinema ejinorense]ARJ31957.1 halocin C8 precursor [Natrinema salaciae]ARJ31958.1 halocin C8 precursor [Natrinema thermotolerans]